MTPDQEDDVYIQEIVPIVLNDAAYPDMVVLKVKGTGGEPSPLQVLSYRNGQYADTTAEVFLGDAGNVFFPREAVVANFSGKGLLGVFIADHGLDAVPFPGSRNTLLLSTPEGHLTNASAHLPKDMGFWHDVSAGDIDGSGRQAIFANNLNDKGTASQLLMNDGAGTFTRRDDFLPTALRQFSARYTACALADVNASGKADLILGTADAAHGPSVVYLNPGNGDFSDVKPVALPPSPLGGVILDISTIRLPGSDHNHLVVVSTNSDYSQHAIQLLVNDGKGHFTDETEARFGAPITGAGWLKRVHIVDVKGDGMPAIITQPVIGPSGLPALVFLCDENGHFKLQQEIPQAAGSVYAVTAVEGQMTFVLCDGKNIKLQPANITLPGHAPASPALNKGCFKIP